MLKTPQDRLRLSRGVGDGLPNRPKDVTALAAALDHFGRYNAKCGEPVTVRSQLDWKLDNALRGFQRNFGLKPDGRVLPGGPTAAVLNTLMAGGLSALEPDPDVHHTRGDFLSRLNLKGSVGEGGDNLPEDKQLARLGLGISGDLDLGAALDQAIDDRRLAVGIEKLHRRLGLSGDGRLTPGGRGEAILANNLKRTYGDKVPDFGQEAGAATVVPVSDHASGAPKVQLAQALSHATNLQTPPPFRSRGKETPQPYDPVAGAVEQEELPARLEVATGAPVPKYVNQTPAVLYNWMEWYRAAKLAGAGKNELFALMEIFGAEGGLRQEQAGGSAVAGILNRTIRDYGPGMGVPASLAPGDLSNAQRIAVYRGYFKKTDGGLGFIGGINGLEKMGERHVAAAVADTVWRNGGSSIGFVLQEGLNEVLAAYPELAERVFQEVSSKGALSSWTAKFQGDPQSYRLFVDNAFGDASLAATRFIAELPEARRMLLRRIAERRYLWDRNRDHRVDTGDINRYMHFAFLEPGETLSFPG